MRRTLLLLPPALLLAGVSAFAPAVPVAPSGNKAYAPKVAPASDEGKRALKRIRVAPGLRADLWAAEPLLANPVALWVDDRGRCYVAETFRLHHGVTDNRGHMNWLNDDLASRTVADRVAMYKRFLSKQQFASYETEHDRVRLVQDTDGDGVADKATVFADGFHNAADGIGSGVLAHKGDVYYACIPDLWLLRDTKGTGTADFRKALSSGYGVHVSFLGHDLHGLRFGPDGRLYFSVGDRGLNVRTKEGKDLVLPDTGAVLRCDPDGSNLEIFATGLRNPQKLAFDAHGNLFTGDNNSDSGDMARWVYVLPGGDSGWCIGYQYDTAMGSRGPFNAEKIWHPAHEGQPAYVVPPIANIADGPSGVCAYSGTGLPEKYKDHFFLCDFRGGSGGSGVWSFAVRPKGASFELVDKQQFVWSLLATDCEFAPDGGLYVTDWTEGWDCTGKGRIYRVSDPALSKSAAVQEVKRLLAEGFDGRPTGELVNLLGHADMRVRQGSQFALAARTPREAVDAFAPVARGGANQLSRLHALWGLGQVARKLPDALGPVADCLGDKDAEVRAQAVKVLGEAGKAWGSAGARKLLADPELRVRLFAALAMARPGDRADAAAVRDGVLALLRENADRDAYLRHAGVMALLGLSAVEDLVPLLKDDAPAVRMAAVLALRRLGSPDVARALGDAEPAVALETARAINDVPINDALPQLAALVTRPNLPAPLLYRVLNANFRLGKAENAAAVAHFAARADAPEALRVEALRELAEWAKPAGRDRVMGLWRPLPQRPANLAADALRESLGGVFAGTDKVRQEAAKAAAALGIKEVGPALARLAADVRATSASRVGALEALDKLNDSRIAAARDLALHDADPRVRVEGRRLLAKADPDAALAELARVLLKGEVVERQGAFAVLEGMKAPGAGPLLEAWLDQLLRGNVPPEVRLDLLDAAAAHREGRVAEKLARYEASRAKGDPLAAYREALAGGDAEAGRQIFFGKAEVSCLRCHKVRGEGGEVGPELAGIGGKQTREYLLESIVEPSKQIAKGFETVVVTLKNGTTQTGVLKGEDAKELRLMTAEGKLVRVPKDQIDERDAGKSAMPDDLTKHLTKSELRDLVEFLAGLKDEPKTK
jgi:quinoprotein glucose dehydrogenase